LPAAAATPTAASASSSNTTPTRMAERKEGCVGGGHTQAVVQQTSAQECEPRSLLSLCSLSAAASAALLAG
jgi:hypothetical protein